MAQAQSARLHGLRTPAPCAERAPPRSRTRARALPDGRSSRFEELFVDDGAAAAKRGAATKKTAPATQPPPPAASVLAEAPPPLDSKGTAAVGVQAAVAFFAVGLVWQLWPLIKLGWRSSVGRWRLPRFGGARPGAAPHASAGARAPPPPPVGTRVPGFGYLTKEQAAAVRAASKARFPTAEPFRAPPLGKRAEEEEEEEMQSSQAYADSKPVSPLPPPPPPLLRRRRETPPPSPSPSPPPPSPPARPPAAPPPAPAIPTPLQRPAPVPPAASPARAQSSDDPWTSPPATAAAPPPPPSERVAFGPAAPPPPDASPQPPPDASPVAADKFAKLRAAAAAVPGTQLFLADDMEAQALTAKRKWWQAAPQLWVVRIADEAQGGSDEVEEVNLAMIYLYGDLPQLLSFEARDDAERCRWLMRSFGLNTIDAVPVPTETIREMVQQSPDGVSVLAVCAGELDLSPAKDLEEFSERLRGLEGVREEYYAQQMLQALRAQTQGRT